MKKKKLKGYMTLEATFVVMIAACVIGCVIFAGFFCYTNVFYKQNCYLAALRGSRQLLMDDNSVAAFVEEELVKLTGDYFFKLENKEQTVETDYFSITVTQSARAGKTMKLCQKATAKRLYPARTIRAYERSKRKDVE